MQRRDTPQMPRPSHENRIDRRNGDEQQIEANIGIANELVKDLYEGKDFMLPIGPDILGSVSFWNMVGEGVKDLWGDVPVVEEIIHVVDVLENGGAVRMATLETVRDNINKTLEEKKQEEQRRAA